MMHFFESLKNNKLFKTGLKYSLISTIKSLLSTGISILIMRWLTPSDLGLWGSVAIFLAYIPFFQLGIQSGLNRDLPILLGQNNEIRAMDLVANAKTIAFIIMIFFIIIGTFAIIIALTLGTDIKFILGVFTILVIAVSETIRIHLIATFRSAKAFDKLTHLYIIDIIVSLLLVYFIYKYHYFGILIYNGLITAVSAFLMYKYAPYKEIRFQLRKEPIIHLTKNGLILMSFAQMRLAGPTIPKWLILSFGNVTQLGLFSPANAIGNLMTMLPDQIATFFNPQIGYKFGQTGSARDLWPYVKKVLIIFPLISLPISLVVWFASPWLLDTIFPQYIDSLWAIKIMSVGFIFSSAITTQGVLYSIKAYNYAYLYCFIEFSGYFLCPFLIIMIFSFDILTSVAIGISSLSILLYLLNALLMRKVLFLEKYNPKTQS